MGDVQRYIYFIRIIPSIIPYFENIRLEESLDLSLLIRIINQNYNWIFLFFKTSFIASCCK